MTFWLALVFPVAVALAIACAFQPALGLQKRRRLAVLVVFELLVLLTPLLVGSRPGVREVPGDGPGYRAGGQAVRPPPRGKLG